MDNAFAMGKKAEGALRQQRTLLLTKISRGLQAVGAEGLHADASLARPCRTTSPQFLAPPWPRWQLYCAENKPSVGICAILPPPSAQGKKRLEDWKSRGWWKTARKVFLNTEQLDKFKCKFTALETAQNLCTELGVVAQISVSSKPATHQISGQPELYSEVLTQHINKTTAKGSVQVQARHNSSAERGGRHQVPPLAKELDSEGQLSLRPQPLEVEHTPVKAIFYTNCT